MDDFDFMLCGEKAWVVSVKGGTCFIRAGLACFTPFEVYNKLKDCDKIIDISVTRNSHWGKDREWEYIVSASVPVEYAIELYEKEHHT